MGRLPCHDLRGRYHEYGLSGTVRSLGTALARRFCSLLIAAGVSPRYVQAQAGHASLTLTVDTYGSWIPPQAQGATDTLAGCVGDWKGRLR